MNRSYTPYLACYRQLFFKAVFTVLPVMVCFITAWPQQKDIGLLEKAVNEARYKDAVALLQEHVAFYRAQPNVDSLVKYIYYTGKITQETGGAEQAVKAVNSYIDKLKKLKPPPAAMRQAYVEAGEYFGSVGKNKLAYDANRQALQYALAVPGKTPASLGSIESNMSTYAQRMGNTSLLQYHMRRALDYFLAEPSPNYEKIYITYNGMGSAMWFASKTDSARYYFALALQALAKTEHNPVNDYYRPAIVQNNLAALYGIDGNTTGAINAMKETINRLKLFLASKNIDAKKVSARTFLYEATDNLAGIYKELGNLKQAQQLLEYSYAEKKKYLEEGDPGIFISEVLLGQLYYATRDFDKALYYLGNGLEKIAGVEGDYLFWQGDACNTLALLYDERHDTARATLYYEKADSLYEASMQGEYDDIYLDFLRNEALFYAETGQEQKAVAKARKGYNYVVKTQGHKTLMAFYQLLNLSQVYFFSGRYQEALTYSKTGLAVVNEKIRSSGSLLDSVKTELKKPKAILMKTRAEYYLLKKKDAAALNALLLQLNEALDILERRKEIITDAEDISLVIADHHELIEFIKQINLDLYNLSGKTSYIDRIMSLQESEMYNRIRSRLDKNDSLKFAHVSAELQLSEKRLKNILTNSLQGEGSSDEKMQRYFNASKDWDNHLEAIKKSYPAYYKLRYASIFKSLQNVEQSVPAGSTLIRYFFTADKLFALVADNRQKQLFSLDKKLVEEQMKRLLRAASGEKETCAVLHSLYNSLWSPLSKAVRHNRLVIIPDGILYNLSFDILTARQVNSYSQLAANCLLASYAISYHYSLFLLQQQSVAGSYKSDYIAFAPGFSDDIKNSYKSSLRDTMAADNYYLSLLPQPFTLQLATRIKDDIGGETFLQGRSTESSFKANAGNHSIIYIGTHAESNNEHPEYSRLIFAKDSSRQEDNFLLADEIYNCNLASDLAVITACESGKPGYQDGEGMISLAHAFNYAGSKSILMGLWKIDEKSSAILIEYFYKNLLKGMPKDEALRQAKLAYLQQAQGRTLSPQYWAGLVVMGDTSPVALAKKTNWWLVAGCIAAAVVLVGVGRKILIKRKSSG
ncbi:CHAT domain-containing protein [Foetidibacter luteolus]|uniref:CHAT domain-containing protein n=1 Tax=Foetidibacter luteolus TaxID=2608880 RepID=UPI00129B3EE3|nr:CHAT domain-containing tetratricopeptide repeat protein [Foetidibacter luteolus]